MKEPIVKTIEYKIGRTGTKLWKVANFLRFFRFGMSYGYPICCVINFAWDRVTKKNSQCAKMRGTIGTFPGSMYVPCKFHMRRHPTWKPYGGAPREQLRLFSDEVGKV